jgi:putative addiction module component (TIGR02574 family)
MKIEDALRLSVEERLRLIETLWESLTLEQGERLGISADMRVEIDGRLAAHRRDPGSTLSWAEVVDRVRGAS